MIAYIVCEGNLDVQLLKIVLPEELLNNVEIVAAGGLSAVKSLARSLIVRRQVPVAIVIDADSVAPEIIQERLKSIEELVESVSANIPFKVIAAVPEMEIIFFQDIGLLSHLLKYKPSQDIITQAGFEPRKSLEILLLQSHMYDSYSKFINLLTNKTLTTENLKILRQAPFIQELIKFLQSVQETATVNF
ncbi:hypothetical protein [Nostoc sp. MS1]|uniref:hypothetical protein n=1 Tax=Nostoc sp. MS1 TaxID=2764711 RepID=UPI001CC7B7A6|nr:hypothetical protein [Nostoc sp. MS1]BCL34091.1 hypothetical protein NSMS1_05380 [Nostoc sp. MS1]